MSSINPSILSGKERTSPPNALLCSGERLQGAAGRKYGSYCCPPVVDPSTLLALLGGIALATYLLRLALVVKVDMGNMGMGGGGRRSRELGLSDVRLHVDRGICTVNASTVEQVPASTVIRETATGEMTLAYHA